MACQKITEIRQAMPFLPEEIALLENAVEELGVSPDALMALHIRTMIAASARFNDL